MQLGILPSLLITFNLLLKLLILCRFLSFIHGKQGKRIQYVATIRVHGKPAKLILMKCFLGNYSLNDYVTVAVYSGSICNQSVYQSHRVNYVYSLPNSDRTQICTQLHVCGLGLFYAATISCPLLLDRYLLMQKFYLLLLYKT